MTSQNFWLSCYLNAVKVGRQLIHDTNGNDVAYLVLSAHNDVRRTTLLDRFAFVSQVNAKIFQGLSEESHDSLCHGVDLRTLGRWNFQVFEGGVWHEDVEAVQEDVDEGGQVVVLQHELGIRTVAGTGEGPGTEDDLNY
jgi:hypothetical protein